MIDIYTKTQKAREATEMEKAKQRLELTEEESATVSRLTVHPPRRVGVDASFYEDFSLRGIRVDRVEPGLVSCTFIVPPRLTVSVVYTALKLFEVN